MPRDRLLKGHLSIPQGCRLLVHGKADIQTPMLLKHVLCHAESFIICANFFVLLSASSFQCND